MLASGIRISGFWVEVWASRIRIAGFLSKCGLQGSGFQDLGRNVGFKDRDFRIWVETRVSRIWTSWFFWFAHFIDFWPLGPSPCWRWVNLESNAIIGVEIYEFRQKLKNLEFLQNSSFWQSPGNIWIDFVSVEVVPSVFFFFVLFGWSGNFGGRLRGWCGGIQ